MILIKNNGIRLSSRVILLLVILFSSYFMTELSAQTSSYILHKIKDGETLSAIAKANKTTVGDIMRLNGMNTKSRLVLGASIKVPITTTSETPTATTNNTPVVMDNNLGIPAKPTVVIPEKKAFIPSTPKMELPTTDTTNTTKYTVVKGDNLYKLSKQFNLTKAQLMQMNNMKDDKVKIGQVLMVNLAQTPIQTPKTIIVDTAKTIKALLPSKAQTKAAMPINPAKKDTNAIIISKPISPIALATVKKEPLIAAVPKLTDTIKNAIVKKDSVMSVNAESTLMAKQTDAPKPPIKDIIATIEKPKPIELLQEPKPINKNSIYVNDEGYFASYFNRKAIADNETVGDAGVFKTASGWEDKKYYILINGLLPGTIVRVSANNKSICAKVLTGLPDIKQDSGYLARLNNAAVAALGIEANKFAVTVNH